MTSVDNVVPFPKPRVPRVPVNPAELSEQAVKREESRFEIVRNIRATGADPSAEFSVRDDEIWPARAVNRLLAQAKARGITHRSIQERLAEKGTPQRHLHRLRVNHTVAPAQAKKEADPDLKKKIEPYLAVLDVLAETLGLSPDEAVLDAFRGTVFSQPVTFPIDDPTVRLNWRLHQMAGWIIRSTRLHAYFEEVRRLRAGYDPTTDEIVFGGAGPNPRQRSTPDGTTSADIGPGDLGYEDYLDMSVPPYPAIPVVPLLRVRRVTLHGSIAAEKAALAPNELRRSEVASLCTLRDQRAVDPMGPTEILPARLDVFTDICLALGPRTRRDDLGPMFEIRSHIELSVQERACQTTFDWSSMPFCARDDIPSGDDVPYREIAEFAGTVAAQLPDGWRRVGRFGKDGLRSSGSHYGIDSLFGITFDGGIQFEPLMGDCPIESAFCLLPVNPGTVDRFVHLIAELGEKPLFAIMPDEPKKWSWLCNLEGPHGSAAEFQFANPTCREFESALYSGTIEEAFAAECHRLQGKLDECKERTEAALKRQDDVLLARWRETE